MVIILVLTTALFVSDESSLSGDDWYSNSVAPKRTFVQSWYEVRGTSTSGIWSDWSWDGDRNLYLSATASVDGRSVTVKCSPTQGEEKGPAPSNVTIGDGLTESPSVLVTRHFGCNPTTVAVLGTGITVAIPRVAGGGLSEEIAACGLSVGGEVSGGQLLTAELGARGGLPRLTGWEFVGFGF